MRIEKTEGGYLLKKYIGGIIIAIFFVAIIFVVYNNRKPSATEEDITIEAALQINDTTINTHKDYLIDINIEKQKDCHVAIYPYIDGVGMMTFSTQEKAEYFIPGSIGSDGVTEPIAITELRDNLLIADGEDISLVGFWFPDEAGQYKARIYLEKLDGFTEIKDPVLVCVYIEERIGSKQTWTKIVPIKY